MVVTFGTTNRAMRGVITCREFLHGNQVINSKCGIYIIHRLFVMLLYNYPLLYFWPTVFGRAFVTACLLSSVVCDVLYCGLYDRQTADVCTYQGVFGDGRFNGIMQNVAGADPCCHGDDIWHRRGDLVAYRIVCLSVTFCIVARTGV